MEYSISIRAPGDADAGELSIIMMNAAESARVSFIQEGPMNVDDVRDLGVGTRNEHAGFHAQLHRHA